MSTENEDIVVEEDATPKELTLEEGVDDLKQRLEAAEARAKAAETARHSAEVAAHEARGTVQETNLHLVSNAIDTLRQSNEIAKANYKAAMSNGDYDAADSEDYFANVETLLGVRKAPAAEEPLSSASRRSTPPPAAPVSRETRGGNVVRLTSEEREMADMMKMTPEEYAKNKVALKKEGRLN